MQTELFLVPIWEHSVNVSCKSLYLGYLVDGGWALESHLKQWFSSLFKWQETWNSGCQNIIIINNIEVNIHNFNAFIETEINFPTRQV